MNTAASRTAVVVGGGPAGLMSAEVLATAGLAVTAYEHMPSVGRKFLLAGRGGLNITHTEPAETFLARYGPAAPRMESALARFGADDLRAWCAGLGEPTFVGSSGRVFPDSFRATPLLRAWLKRLESLGVELRVRHRWEGVTVHEQTQQHVFRTADSESMEVLSNVTVMAMGGASWPRVGSDASWVPALQAGGVAVSPLAPANCGLQVRWTPTFLERSEGTPVKDVTLSAGGVASRGDIVITRSGLEGGPVYALAAAMRLRLVSQTPSPLFVDLRPDLAVGRVEERLLKRRPKDSASTWLRKAGFAPVEVGLLREATHNELPAAAGTMAALCKSVPIPVDGLMPLERAISTAGGVSFSGLEASLMVTALPGVFVAGEMLDWEAPTGGYLLQGCFSTAVQAAQGALAWMGQSSSQA